LISSARGERMTSIKLPNSTRVFRRWVGSSCPKGTEAWDIFCLFSSLYEDIQKESIQKFDCCGLNWPTSYALSWWTSFILNTLNGLFFSSVFGDEFYLQKPKLPKSLWFPNAHLFINGRIFMRSNALIFIPRILMTKWIKNTVRRKSAPSTATLNFKALMRIRKYFLRIRNSESWIRVR